MAPKKKSAYTFSRGLIVRDICTISESKIDTNNYAVNHNE